MNILFLSHERKLGGANLSLYGLATQMKECGHKVYVSVLYNSCPLAIRLRKQGVTTIPCFYGWWVMPRDWNIVLKASFRLLHFVEFLPLKKLCKVVDEKNIDIIYSNTSCIDIGAKLACKTGKKHVWHFREFAETHYNFEFLLGHKRSIDFVNNYSDRVLFISNALRDYYQDITSEEKTSVIYNGVSTQNIINIDDKILVGKDRKKTVFLMAGNISSGKNQFLAVQAVKLILEQEDVLDSDFELWIAGEATSLLDSQEYKKQIQEYIEVNNLINIKMLGFVDDMVSLRKNTNVEIIASLNEAFGRVTVEAMMGRNFVLASDTGANPELLCDGEYGYLFKSQDVNSLAEAMRGIICQTIYTDDIIEKAFTYAVNNYTIEQNTKKIETVFQDLLVDV